MNGNLCTRMKRQLKRIGQDEKTARRYAGSFYLWMLSVCGLFGVPLCSDEQSGAGEEIRGSLRPGPDGTPEVSYGSGAGAGPVLADARAVSILSASFGLGQR
jgi:hypothetical protein